MDIVRFMLTHCYKSDLYSIIGISFLAGLIPIITPIITETIFQDIIPMLERSTLATVTQVSMVSGFTLTAISIVRSIATLRLVTNVDLAVESALFGRIISLPTKFFRQFQSGELANRLVGAEMIVNSISGKSTLVRLLLGFEKPKSGAIYYDGQDLSELNLASVRVQMGIVLQNGQIMAGDIFTNIIGTSSLTLEDAWQATEAAGLAEDIKKMPMGMNTVISEGSTNISGGQRQRILIARAIAAKPAIVVFDEATSALDNRTQNIVTESLDKMHATQIIVAHRLSTIRNCDKIIVMDSGRIVETGTFEELSSIEGLFADLIKRQQAMPM